MFLKCPGRMPRTVCSRRREVEKDRQCTYNLTWRRVRATIVTVEKAINITFLSVCL